jgi:hypothetical protein
MTVELSESSTIALFSRPARHTADAGDENRAFFVHEA